MLFLETEKFSKKAVTYLTDEAYAALQVELIADPEGGDLIQGTGGARKIRIPLQGRGKRGGGRVVYYYKAINGVILLLTLYPKNEKTNLDEEDLRYLRNEIHRLKRGGYP